MKCFGHLSKATIFPLLFLLVTSCGKGKTADIPTITPPPAASDADLTILPKDAGGVQTPVYLTNTIPYGYYVYTPSGYTNNQASYPLLVFLHGSGEVGNSMTTPNTIKRVLAHGPPELISKKNWSPKYPMLVVSPQCSSTFDPDSLNEFIKYIIKTYRVNTHRIYLTGLSLGGGGVFDYMTHYANNSSYVAAAVPMSAAFEKRTNLSYLVNVPIWTFVGQDDTVFPKLKYTIDLINQLKTTLKAKITVFPGIGHDCWDLAYAGTGKGSESKSYDAFNTNIYDWLFQYAK